MIQNINGCNVTIRILWTVEQNYSKIGKEGKKKKKVKVGGFGLSIYHF